MLFKLFRKGEKVWYDGSMEERLIRLGKIIHTSGNPRKKNGEGGNKNKKYREKQRATLDDNSFLFFGTHESKVLQTTGRIDNRVDQFLKRQSF